MNHKRYNIFVYTNFSNFVEQSLGIDLRKLFHECINMVRSLERRGWKTKFFVEVSNDELPDYFFDGVRGL